MSYFQPINSPLDVGAVESFCTGNILSALTFSGKDGRRLFEPLLEHLKLLTESSGIITAVTSFGGSWYGDRLLASNADRVIRIEQPSKKLIRILDDGYVKEYVPVPSGQMRFTDFTDFDIMGVDVYGQDNTILSYPA